MSAKPIKTTAQVRADFAEAGISVAEWARTHGFHRETVVDVLRGKSLGTRGESHRAAIALGLKHGHVVAVAQFMPAPPKPQPLAERRTGARTDRRGTASRRDSTQPDRRARKAA